MFFVSCEESSQFIRGSEKSIALEMEKLIGNFFLGHAFMYSGLQTHISFRQDQT